MRSVPPSPHIEPMRLLAFAGTWVMVVLIACSRAKDTKADSTDTATTATPAEPRPTPRAPFTNIDSASHAAVMSYANSLSFDSSEAAVGVTRVRGDTVKWMPEIGAGGIPHDDLVAGRIIGKVVTETTDRSAFGTRRGVSYLWVKQVSDSTAAGVFIPTVEANPRVRTTVYFGNRPFSHTDPTQFRIVRDSFANGRCNDRCCIVGTLATTYTQALISELSAEVHR